MGLVGPQELGAHHHHCVVGDRNRVLTSWTGGNPYTFQPFFVDLDRFLGRGLLFDYLVPAKAGRESSVPGPGEIGSRITIQSELPDKRRIPPFRHQQRREGWGHFSRNCSRQTDVAGIVGLAATTAVRAVLRDGPSAKMRLFGPSDVPRDS